MPSRRGLCLLVVGIGLTTACGEQLPDAIGQREHALAAPGRWTLPADVAAAGAPLVRYDGPPPWDGGANCTGTFTEGARALRDFLNERFPQIREIQGYSCRQNTANAAETSVHGTGRALDVMIPLDSGAADNGIGDEVANWLVVNSSAIGV